MERNTIMGIVISVFLIGFCVLSMFLIGFCSANMIHSKHKDKNRDNTIVESGTINTQPTNDDYTKIIIDKANALRKRYNNVHIYSVSNKYEVWCSGAFGGKWSESETLEGARKIVDDYYIQWAKNATPIPDKELVPHGVLVE